VIFQRARRTEHDEAIGRGTLDGDPCLAQANLAPLGVAPAHGEPLGAPSFERHGSAGFAAVLRRAGS